MILLIVWWLFVQCANQHVTKTVFHPHLLAVSCQEKWSTLSFIQGRIQPNMQLIAHSRRAHYSSLPSHLLQKWLKRAIFMNNILSFIQLFLPIIYWMNKQVGASICLQCGVWSQHPKWCAPVLAGYVHLNIIVWY
jgi:hypothetical protein